MLLQTMARSQKRPPPESRGVKKRKPGDSTLSSDDKVSQAAPSFATLWSVRMENVGRVREQLMGTAWNEQPTKTRLIFALNSVRAIGHRPGLTGKEITLVHAIPEALAGYLLSLFFMPFAAMSTLGVATNQLLNRDSPADTVPKSDNGQPLAQYYLRSLPFDSKDAAKSVLSKVLRTHPHYRSHIEALLVAIDQLPHSSFVLRYAGLTVADSPVGRHVDDQVDDSTTFHSAVIAQFAGKVGIDEVLPLRFSTESVIDARADARLDLYESLLVDCLGFACLNTAPPGTILDFELSEEEVRLIEALEAHGGEV